MALSLSKVSKTFYKGTNDERIALDDVSLELSEGTFAVVIGSNGAGKSTLLNVISGQLPLDAGSVQIDAREMAQEPEHVRAALISRVMQDPQRGTLATMTIEENLALADMRHQGRGLKRALSAQRRERFAQTLAGFGLGLEQRLGSRVGLLSGGQRQGTWRSFAARGGDYRICWFSHPVNSSEYPATCSIRIAEIKTSLVFQLATDRLHKASRDRGLLAV